MVAVFVLLVAIVAFSIPVLNTQFAQNAVKNRVNSSIPGEFTWSSVHLSPFSGELRIKEFKLMGPKKEALAGFDALAVNFRLLPLLKKRLVIQSIHIDKPSVLLTIDSTGQLNLLSAFPLPDTTARKDTMQDTSALLLPDVVIKSFKISNGRFSYTQPEMAAHIKTFDLNGRIHLIDTTGHCEIGLGPMDISKNGVTSIVQSVLVNIRLAKGGKLDSKVKIQTDRSALEITSLAQQLFSKPNWNIKSESRINFNELSRLVGISPAINGRGNINFRLNGTLDNPDVALTTALYDMAQSDIKIPAVNLSLRIKDKMVELDSMSIHAWTGRVRLSGKIDAGRAFPNGFLDGTKDLSQLRYSLVLAEKGVDLSQLPKAWFEGKGRPKLKLSIDGQGVDPKVLNLKSNLNLNISSFSMHDAVRPFDISLTAQGGISKGVVGIPSLQFRSEGIRTNLMGRYALRSGVMDVALALSAEQLEESLKPFGILNMAGTLDLNASAKGTIKQLVAKIDVKSDNFAYDAYRIGNVRLNAETEKNGTLNLKQLEIRNNASNLNLSGHARLIKNGRIVPFDDLSYEVHINEGRVGLQDFMDSANCQIQLSGQVVGQGKRIGGQVQLNAKDVRYKNLSLRKIQSTIQLEDGDVIIDTFSVSLDSGGVLSLTGTYKQSGQYSFKMNTTGLSLKEIPGLMLPDSSDGQVTLQLSGNGDAKNPTLSGWLETGSVSILGQPMADNRLQFYVKDSLVSLSGKLLGEMNASYHMSDGRFHAVLNLNHVSLAPYLRLLGQEGFSGRVTTRLKVNGLASKPDGISAEWQHENLVLFHSGVKLLTVKPFVAQFQAGAYSVDDLEIQLLDSGYLHLGATGLIRGKSRVTIKSQLPLAGLSPFLPDLKGLKGMLGLRAEVRGNLENPVMTGELSVHEGGLLIPGLEQQMHRISGNIHFSNDSLQIKMLQGYLDDGAFRLSGGAVLDSFQVSEYGIQLGLNALPVRVPEQLDLKLDGTLSASGRSDSGMVRGELVLLDGLYYQDIKINLFRSLTQRKRSEGPPPDKTDNPFLKGLNLDIGIVNRQPFAVDNNLAMMALKPDVSISGTALNPGLTGRAWVESGTIFFQKKNFEVKKGIVDFLNPYKIEPTLDIHSNVVVRDWSIHLFLKGTTSEMDFKLHSDPPLPQEDILSLLAVGKTTAELLGNEDAPTTPTEQLLRQAVANMGARVLQASTGLDVLEIETGANNETGPSDVKVTMGKRLSRRLLTKYSMESREGVLVQQATAEYQLLENLILSGFQDTRGVYGGEMKLKLEFR